MADPLAEYREKRDFERTSEPVGDDAARDATPVFVVQEHQASSHHFDLRFEADGVLKSWAVPKGPSTDPSEKRLAVRTEDHPLDYADFEGTIPEDEYGGGSVVVWDIGPFRNLTTDEDGDPVTVEDAVERKGHLRVWVEGQKLRGGYSLVHARIGGEDDNWLLTKEDDEGADARRRPTSTEPESVLTGRTLDEVATTGAGDDGGE